MPVGGFFNNTDGGFFNNDGGFFNNDDAALGPVSLVFVTKAAAVTALPYFVDKLRGVPPF